MLVLVADAFERSGLDGLTAAGCDVVYRPELTGDELTGAIAATGADVLVVRSTRVTEAMLDAGRLSLVVRAGAGYNTIDVEAASRLGVFVANCPGRNAVAVAELAFALMLALDRRVPDAVADLRAGRWNKKEYARARGLYGRTLGLLGLGRIGCEMIGRAVAFGMPVVAWSRRFDGRDGALTRDEAEALGLGAGRRSEVNLAPSPADVAGRCDVLSLHLALGDGTRGLVDARILGALREGAFVINTARAELIDDAALAEAVRAKGLRVGLDVYAAEPAVAVGSFSDPIVALPGVYGTHHVGASTEQAQEAIAAETVRVIHGYKTTGRVPNVVNLSRRTPATHMLVVRHRDRPGVLAHVFDHLKAAALNVQETENVVFAGAHAAVARINLDGVVPAGLLDRIRSGSPDILDLHLVTLSPD